MEGAVPDQVPFSDGRHIVLPPLVNAHTHCADAGAKPTPGMTLEELVAPPDGLKHRYLRSTPRDRLVEDMAVYSKQSETFGIRSFVDFREGGAEGCRMLREASPNAFVMGRPVSPEFDPSELDEILSVSDGIALPSVSDMDSGYVESCADAAHKAGKPFAIHVSERVREDIEFVLSLEPAFVVHMVQATDSDLRRCADEGVPVAVCPRSNRFFGLTPPLGRMLDSGVNIAFGTDNAMLCSPDLRQEALLASEILMCQKHESALVFPILRNGTLTMAERLGIDLGEGSVVLSYDGDPLSALSGDTVPAVSDMHFERRSRVARTRTYV